MTMTKNIKEEKIQNKIKVSIMRNIITAEEIKTYLNSDDIKRKSLDELFEAISTTIDKMYDYQRTREESREAARNFISFYQLIVDHSAKLHKANKAQEKNNSGVNNVTADKK